MDSLSAAIVKSIASSLGLANSTKAESIEKIDELNLQPNVLNALISCAQQNHILFG